MVEQNQNELSFKNFWSLQSLYYINIFLHCLPFKWFRIALLPSMSRDMKEADIAPSTLGDILRYLGLWPLMSICSGWRRGICEATPPLIKRQTHAPITSGDSCLNNRFNAITRELRFINTNPPPYVDKFWKIFAIW